MRAGVFSIKPMQATEIRYFMAVLALTAGGAYGSVPLFFDPGMARPLP
jgi:hypothetical protein